MYYDIVNSGERIKELRAARRMTRQQLAEQIGLSVDALRKIEAGVNGAKIDTLISIAELFHISLRCTCTYAKTGRINCIIVKDLSRLGRNYVEMGNYIERVFPFLNVRFIAVTDDFDSFRPGTDLMMPLKNIVNEFYAKDIHQLPSSTPLSDTFKQSPYFLTLFITSALLKFPIFPL